jgi:acetyl esterase
MADPALFRPEAIDAETLAFNKQLEELLSQQKPTHLVPPADTRRAREEGGGTFGKPVLDPGAVERKLPGRDGDVTVRVITPSDGKVNGVYLDIHGGGWVLGRAHHGDPRNRQIADNAGVAVVSVDYRLAPEDPYPAGPDDCEDAAAWLIANAKAEFGSDALLIGGGSAGAHLAAVTLLRMRDRHGYTGFKGANLVFGVYDVSQSPSSYTWGERYLVLSGPMMKWFGDRYAEGRDLRDPDVSPLFANLRDMPPALFTVGTMDPLLDDSLFMHGRWIAAGNEGELAVYPGGVHGFTGMPNELGRKANRHADAWLKARLG